MSLPLIVACRGDSLAAPENTLPAFESAIHKGADTIEFDVHMTTDGELIVHHFFNLGSTNDGSGCVGDYTLAELQRLDAGGWFDPCFAGTRMPRLEDVLVLGKGRVRFEIDMKGSSLEFLRNVIDAVKRLGVQEDSELTTAHVPLLFHAKSIDPALHTGMFFYPLPEYLKPSLGQRHILDAATLTDVQVVHLHPSLITGEFVEELHRSGLLVHGSNLNTPDEIAMAFDFTLDQFSTSQLDLALDTRRDRAQQQE